MFAQKPACNTICTCLQYLYLLHDLSLGASQDIKMMCRPCRLLPLVADVGAVLDVQVLVALGSVTDIDANLVLVHVPPHAALHDGLVDL